VAERNDLGVDPRLFSAFVAVADELHFGRAAQRLHVAQPAVSQQLQRLEKQLGVRLFERTRHHVALTTAGEYVLPYARQALAATAAVSDAAREAAGDAPVSLEVAFTPGVHYLAERVLAAFARTRPDVHVRAIADNTGAISRLVSGGSVELALGFASSPTHGVHRERLCDEPVVVAVSRTHPLASRVSVRPAELATHTIAMVDARDGAGYNDATQQICRRAGFEPRRPPNPSGPMAWETAVRSKRCVGLTTRISAASTLRDINVIRLEGDATFGIDLLTPAGIGTLSPAADAFAHYARRVALAASRRGRAA
jgi:DNA-binding transcriptional LysR family regulator